MTENNSEKRRQTRIPIEEEIYVRDTGNSMELGTLANIHDEGFMVISDGGLKEDHLYQVVFELGGDKGVIELGAECLWISDTGTGDQVWAGFQIMSISDEAREEINKLKEQYQD